MELIEGSETSAFKPQMPGKYPKENILHDIMFVNISLISLSFHATKLKLTQFPIN